MGGFEVRDAGRADVTLVGEREQRFPRVDHASETRARPVDEIHVEVADAESAGALLGGGDRLVEPVVATAELGLDDHLVTPDTRTVHSHPDTEFVAVPRSGVEKPVARLDRRADRTDARPAEHVVGPESHHGDRGTVAELDRGDVHLTRIGRTPPLGRFAETKWQPWVARISAPERHESSPTRTVRHARLPLTVLNMSALTSRSPVSRTMRTLVSVLAGLGMVLLGTTAPPAHADDAVSVGIPNWSGLDVTEYAGPIPAKAGTLITQVPPLAESLNLPAAGKAYRIQYSSLNQHGKMATGTGAVFLPKGDAPAGGWPIISWAHGTVGMNDDCTPSAFPRSERDQKYLGHWLNQGYAVVAADYVGLGTPRSDGLPERRDRGARERRHRRRIASDGSAAGQALGHHRTVAGCGRRAERRALRHRVQPWIGSGLPRRRRHRHPGQPRIPVPEPGPGRPAGEPAVA